MSRDPDFEGGRQQVLLQNDESEERPEDHAWKRALSHAGINHRRRSNVISDEPTPPEDVLGEYLVSWTTNFLGVIDHEHEWRGFDG